MHILWNHRSAPRVIAPVKIPTTLPLTSGFIQFSACPSAATISAWTFLSQAPSANISVWIFHEKSRAHLDLWQQWKSGPCCFWRRNLHHLVHVQVQRWSPRQISCLGSPLPIFQYEHPLTTIERTLIYGSSDNFDPTLSDARIYIT